MKYHLPNLKQEIQLKRLKKTKTSGEKVEIKLWLDDDDYAAAIEPAIEAVYPNIDIVYEKVGAVDARSKLELDGQLVLVETSSFNHMMG